MKLYLCLKLLLVSVLFCTPFTAYAQLQPYTSNPYYWEYRGEPVLLLGGSIHSNLFQINNLRAHLDEIKAAGGNYVRNTMNQRTPWNLPGDLMLPYRSVGNGKYDLNKWNNAYWTAFKNMLQLANERDIIVQIELWDHWDFAGNSWQTNAFRPANNVNYTTSESGLSNTADSTAWRDLQPFFHTVLNNNTFLLDYQEAFVRKVLSISLQYPNVLYTMNNETETNAEWGEYWANFIKTEALRVGAHVETSEMRNEKNTSAALPRRSYDNPEIFSFLDISNSSLNFDQQHWNNLKYVRDYIKNAPRPINYTKIYSDGNTSWGSGNPQQGVERFWRNLIGGAASSRFHRPHQTRPVGIGLNNTAKNSIAAARKLESKIPLWDVNPSMDLLAKRSSDEAYLAADPGEKYALYFTKGGSVDLKINAASGSTFTASWINIDSGKWGAVKQISGNGTVTITAPDRGAWVVAIVKNNEGGNPPVNKPPVAKNDNATTDQGQAVSISVLGNDSDPDGDRLGIQSFSQGSKGRVSKNGTRLVYMPNTNSSGNDSFNYTVSDGNGGRATARVNITVKAAVLPPSPGDNMINVDGNASDWAGISAISTASGQNLRSLKVTHDADRLYFLLEGSNIGAYTQIHLNVDNNAATGYQSSNWSSSGVDYLIENGNLYESSTNDSNWNWGFGGSSVVVYERSSSLVEVSVKKSALSGLKGTIKVGAWDLSSSWNILSGFPGFGGAMIVFNLDNTPPPTPSGKYPESIKNPENFHPGHYMRVGADYHGDLVSKYMDLIENMPEFVGVKQAYSWYDIEPSKGEYDFSAIERDLKVVQSKGKYLWISIAMTSWNSRSNPKVPRYMWNDSQYGCGNGGRYGTYGRTSASGGWLPCYGDKEFSERYIALMTALGERFNKEPYFEGINLGETSTGRGNPNTNTPEKALAAFKKRALAVKKAFPDKTVMQMVNYAQFDIESFADWLTENGIATGGPDVHLAKGTDPNSGLYTAYGIHKKNHWKTPNGIDVQWDNWTRDGRKYSSKQLLDGAVELINPWYMFWVKRQPVFNDDVLPTIKKAGHLPAARKFYSNNGNNGNNGGGNISITVDGNVSDWAGISAISTASGQNLRSLKVTDDADRFYFLLEGQNIDANTQLHLNVDGQSSTGYQSDNWSRSGIDYLIENGSLYKSTKNDASWSWSPVDSTVVVYKRSSSVVEVSVKKFALSGLKGAIKVGAWDLNGSWNIISGLPGWGKEMATYK